LLTSVRDTFTWVFHHEAHLLRQQQGLRNGPGIVQDGFSRSRPLRNTDCPGPGHQTAGEGQALGDPGAGAVGARVTLTGAQKGNGALGSTNRTGPSLTLPGHPPTPGCFLSHLKMGIALGNDPGGLVIKLMIVPVQPPPAPPIFGRLSCCLAKQSHYRWLLSPNSPE